MCRDENMKTLSRQRTQWGDKVNPKQHVWNVLLKIKCWREEINKFKFSFCEYVDKPDYNREILWKFSVLSFQNSKFFAKRVYLILLKKRYNLFGCVTAKKKYHWTPWKVTSWSTGKTYVSGEHGLNMCTQKKWSTRGWKTKKTQNFKATCFLVFFFFFFKHSELIPGSKHWKRPKDKQGTKADVTKKTH